MLERVRHKKSNYAVIIKINKKHSVRVKQSIFVIIVNFSINEFKEKISEMKMLKKKV